MASVKDHYDSHLGPLYTWMSGGSEGPRTRFAELLRSLNLRPTHSGATALDLGAGNGFQALPLAQAGFRVTAVDLSEVLLAELARDAASANAALSIRPVLGDLREVSHHCPQPAVGAHPVACQVAAWSRTRSCATALFLPGRVLPPGGPRR